MGRALLTSLISLVTTGRVPKPYPAMWRDLLDQEAGNSAGQDTGRAHFDIALSKEQRPCFDILSSGPPKIV